MSASLDPTNWQVLLCEGCEKVLRVPREGIGEAAYVRCPWCGEGLDFRRANGEPGGTADAPIPVPVAEIPRGGAAVAPPSANEWNRRTNLPDPKAPVFEAPVRETSVPELSPEAEVVADMQRQRSHSVPMGWEQNPAPRAERGDRTAGRVIRLAAILLFVVTAAILIVVFFQDERTAEVAGQPAEAPAASAPVVATEPEADEEVDLIIDYQELTDVAARFMKAPSVDALVPLVREPERVEPLMRAHYEHTPYRVLGFKGILDRQKAEVADTFVLTRVEARDFSQRLIAMEKTPDGFLVDWESFVGYSDLPWTDLLVRPPAEPVLVRTFATRDNYYNYDFADPSAVTCFALVSPDRNIKIYGYAPAGSEMAEELARLIDEGGGEGIVTLRIRYPEKRRKNNQVWIEELVQGGWVRGVDAAAGGALARDAAPSPPK